MISSELTMFMSFSSVGLVAVLGLISSAFFVRLCQMAQVIREQRKTLRHHHDLIVELSGQLSRVAAILHSRAN